MTLLVRFRGGALLYVSGWSSLKVLTLFAITCFDVSYVTLTFNCMFSCMIKESSYSSLPFCLLVCLCVVFLLLR